MAHRFRSVRDHGLKLDPVIDGWLVLYRPLAPDMRDEATCDALHLALCRACGVNAVELWKHPLMVLGDPDCQALPFFAGDLVEQIAETVTIDDDELYWERVSLAAAALWEELSMADRFDLVRSSGEPLATALAADVPDWVLPELQHRIVS